MYKCKKCQREFKNETGLKCHKCKKIINHICPKCNLYICTSIKKHINCCDGKGPRKRKNDNIWDYNKNKNYIELYGIEKSLKIKDKISKSLIGKSKGISGSPEKEKIRKDKIRIKILERYSNGWEVKCGRCKKLDYHSDIAGDVKLDGGWELLVAKYLDSLNIKWIRNKQRFKYWNSIKNCESTYCPDFYVEDWNKYIEVKGYKTDLDEIKWKQFKEELEIWDKNRLKELGIKIK